MQPDPNQTPESHPQPEPAPQPSPFQQAPQPTQAEPVPAPFPPAPQPLEPTPQPFSPAPQQAQPEPTPHFQQPLTPNTPIAGQQAGPVPGRTLGIIGFVFAFVFLSVPGLVLSIISFVKSVKAKRLNGLALAAVILNTLAIIGTLLWVAITLASYGNINERANTATGSADASTIAAITESYHSANGVYPATYSLIKADVDTATGGKIQLSTDELTVKPSDPNVIAFYNCGTEGNKIGYWSYSDNKAAYTYSGAANESSACTPVTQ